MKGFDGDLKFERVEAAARLAACCESTLACLLALKSLQDSRAEPREWSAHLRAGCSVRYLF